MNKKYLLGALLTLAMLFSVPAITAASTVSWQGMSSGGAQCAIQKNNICTMGCSVTYNGTATCSPYLSQGVSWNSVRKSGNSACAEVGKACYSGYNSSGYSYNCSTSNYGGFALCPEPTSQGAVWKGVYKTGGSACAEYGRECKNAYNYYGVATSCSSMSSTGSALCNAPATKGVVWDNAWNTGDSACAVEGRTCKTSYNYNGSAISCSSAVSTGSALCDATATKGVVWDNAWNTGDSACAVEGRTCKATFNGYGNKTSCNYTARSGSALCDSTVTQGVSWSDASRKSGNAACSEISKPCQTAYDSYGRVSSCSTDNYGGSALCDISLDLSASPTSVTCGGTSTLSWSSKNSTSCSAATGPWKISGTSGTFVTDPINLKTTYYSMSCLIGGKSVPASVTVSAVPSKNFNLYTSTTHIIPGASAKLVWNTDGANCWASSTPYNANWYGQKSSTTTEYTIIPSVTRSTNFWLNCCQVPLNTFVSVVNVSSPTPTTTREEPSSESSDRREPR